jgi:hypothetical protein
LREFKTLNLTSDALPECDVILVRDCLVHLSYKDIYAALKNIKSSNCKYLLTTTFTDTKRTNYDILTGDWRPINLTKKPFNFSEPVLVINEDCTENKNSYKDKSLALWGIKDLAYNINS